MASVGLTDREFAEDWMRYFGSTRGPVLWGWLVLASILGSDLSERDLLRHGPMSRATRYRHIEYLKGYAASLKARGLMVEEREGLEVIARGIAGLRGSLAS
jgi:hypothetical protein